MVIRDAAREYLMKGYSVLPVGADKRPKMLWAHLQKERMNVSHIPADFTGAQGIGIICGRVSGNLEVIDVDLKYDPTGLLWEELQRILSANLPEVLGKLVIAKTKSGGYHLFYKSPVIAGNEKLASRLTTEAERMETYKANIEAGESEEQAERAQKNDKVRVLIETRGEGGYVVAYPSPGYEFTRGNLATVPDITKNEREILLEICRSFNQVAVPERRRPEVQQAPALSSSDGSPFHDYNQRGDLVGLLERHGWSVVGSQGERIMVKRPGSTDSVQSGNFHMGLRKFMVFSTSTEFEPGKAYSPSDVFIKLECKDDMKQAARELIRNGYGTPRSSRPSLMLQTNSITVRDVNNVNTVISSPGDLLKMEEVLEDKVLIESPGPEAREEVLRALDVLQQAGKVAYVKEGEDQYRDYAYRLAILKEKYAKLEEDQYGLSDMDIDLFTEELQGIGGGIANPVDRDRFTHLALNEPDIQALGITRQSLEVAMDRIRASRDKERQDASLKELMDRVEALREKGKPGEAIKLLGDKLPEIRLKDKAAQLGKLLATDTEEAFRERIKSGKAMLFSGYRLDDTDILFPSGALSVIAAPTGHGKSLMLGNIAVNLLKLNPEKEFHYFTYEESPDRVKRNILNIFQGEKLSARTRESIDSYFAGEEQYIRPEKLKDFKEKVDIFFNDYLSNGRLRVHYIDPQADNLVDAVQYLTRYSEPGAVLVDYIQLLETEEGSNRQEEMKKICQKLKDVAVDTDLPIILAAQFNRNVTHQLKLHATNIREAGDIEQAANLIIGIWNNNQLSTGLTTEDIKSISQKGMSSKETIYAVILKYRDGKAGVEGIWSYYSDSGKIGQFYTKREPLNKEQ